MFWGVVDFVLKTLAFAVFVIVAAAIYHHIRAKRQISRFVGQGMYSYPNNEKFFVGMVGSVVKYFDLVEKNKDQAYPHLFRFLM